MEQSDLVGEHFLNPRHVGTLPADDPDVGTGRVEAATHGDVTRLQVRVDRVSGLIREARFKAFGCSVVVASASLATEWVTGRTLAAALAITADEIAAALSLSVEKTYCAELAQSAIRAAIGDYETKCGSSAELRTESHRCFR